MDVALVRVLEQIGYIASAATQALKALFISYIDVIRKNGVRIIFTGKLQVRLPKVTKVN
jgi:hypothetical protein